MARSGAQGTSRRPRHDDGVTSCKQAHNWPRGEGELRDGVSEGGIRGEISVSNTATHGIVCVWVHPHWGPSPSKRVLCSALPSVAASRAIVKGRPLTRTSAAYRLPARLQHQGRPADDERVCHLKGHRLLFFNGRSKGASLDPGLQSTLGAAEPVMAGPIMPVCVPHHSA